MNTENLYLAALACTNGGGVLRRVMVSAANGRKTAVFELECPGADDLVTSFYDGTAVVNLADYRNHLEELKDELFRALRSGGLRSGQSKTKTETKNPRRSCDATHRTRRAGGAQARR